MKRILFLFITFLFTTFISSAQNPSWAKKAASAVFTLKTFLADGTLSSSSNGFFISEEGDAVSNFTPFKGAQRAVVIDANGNECPVECIIGANEMYDVAKFKVAAKKPTALTIATTAPANGADVWLLPYSVKKTPSCIHGTVSKSELFQEKYNYYTLSMSGEEQHTSCPILNDDGQVIGMLQPSADNLQTNCYAVSASFISDMHVTGLSVNDATLRLTNIPKAIPQQYDEALLSLFMSSSVMDSIEYSSYLDRFIQQYPSHADGYIYRARQAAAAGRYTNANEDMEQAIKVAEKKDDVHYQFAQLIYQKEIYQNNLPYEEWSLDRALEESKQAYEINPMPIYRQQQAEILFAQKKYEEAYAIYDELTKSDLRNADIFYAAAQCQLHIGDQQKALALADSAINQFTRPYIKTAAPYLLARGQMLHNAGKYRPAVNDYNEYEALMSAQLSADFYYLREQAEFSGHLYQQALNDIQKAVEMSPNELIYYVEKANVELRVGLTDEGLKTAQTLISMNSQSSEGHLLLGIAQCIKGDKPNGLSNLNKAKELGNSQAQAFIDKYSH